MEIDVSLCPAGLLEAVQRHFWKHSQKKRTKNDQKNVDVGFEIVRQRLDHIIITILLSLNNVHIHQQQLHSLNVLKNDGV